MNRDGGADAEQETGTRTTGPPYLKPWVPATFIAGVMLLAVNRLLLRPWVLEHVDSEAFVTFVYSFPNFLEAVFGTTFLASLGMVFALHVVRERTRRQELGVYIGMTLLAAVHVILQEIDVHHLGGENVYDPNDVIASAIGLLATFVILCRFGVLRHGWTG